MFEIIGILVLNLYIQNKINKDEVYFLEEEKSFYTLLLWIIPVLGGSVILYKLNEDRGFEIQLKIIFLFMSIGMYMLYRFIKHFMYSSIFIT